mgnify:CR=1 FL=1
MSKLPVGNFIIAEEVTHGPDANNDDFVTGAVPESESFLHDSKVERNAIAKMNNNAEKYFVAFIIVGLCYGCKIRRETRFHKLFGHKL